jgi:hypothetical protein
VSTVPVSRRFHDFVSRMGLIEEAQLISVPQETVALRDQPAERSQVPIVSPRHGIQCCRDSRRRIKTADFTTLRYRIHHRPSGIRAKPEYLAHLPLLAIGADPDAAIRPMHSVSSAAIIHAALSSRKSPAPA